MSISLSAAYPYFPKQSDVGNSDREQYVTERVNLLRENVMTTYEKGFKRGKTASSAYR